jgi:hypothetical protein
MKKQARFVTLLGLLLMGGITNSYAQAGQTMGGYVPADGGRGGGGSIDNRPPPGVGPYMDLGAATGVLEAKPVKLTDFSTVSGQPSAARQFTVSGFAATVGLKAPQGFELSLQEAGGYSPSLNAVPLPATVWVRLTGSKPNSAARVSGDIGMSSTNEKTHTSSTGKMHVEGVVD